MQSEVFSSSHPTLAAYRHELEVQAETGRLRRCRLVSPAPGASSSMQVQVDGRAVVNFSSNDYLGLAHDARLQAASVEALGQYGTGSAGSRLITGTGPLVQVLESTLAGFKQAEAALVFNSGYQANVAILQALLTPEDRVFCDKLNHASLMDGCLWSGARWSRYRHLDLAQLEARLQKAPVAARKWIVTDSVFSMDGDYPDLRALADLAESYQALLLVDEAHATGLYGDTRSSGLCEQYGVSGRVALQMGTFSKALGGFGAYVAGPRTLIDTLVNRSRGFIYSTALPPGVWAAALEAVRLVQADCTMKSRLWSNVRRLETLLRAAGLSAFVPSGAFRSAIVPFVVGDNVNTLALSDALLEAGYFVQGIRPPTVPPGTARLRIALSAAHTETDLQGLVTALRQGVDALSVEPSPA